jgi:hypothetical protein
MLIRVVVLYVVLLLPSWAIAQVSVERTAMNNLSKQKWDRARGQLKKAIRKDSLSTAAHYTMAHYFFAPTNPDFQIDSAYRYTMKAMEDFQLSSFKQRERLKRFPIDSAILVAYRDQIY